MTTPYQFIDVSLPEKWSERRTSEVARSMALFGDTYFEGILKQYGLTEHSFSVLEGTEEYKKAKSTFERSITDHKSFLRAKALAYMEAHLNTLNEIASDSTANPTARIAAVKEFERIAGYTGEAEVTGTSVHFNFGPIPNGENPANTITLQQADENGVYRAVELPLSNFQFTEADVADTRENVWETEGGPTTEDEYAGSSPGMVRHRYRPSREDLF